jgi:hypothetical protein
MRCQDVERRLSAYLDGELGEHEAAGVEEHLTDCGSCAAMERETRGAVDGLRALPGLDAPEGMWSRIAAELDAQPEPRPSWAERFARWRWALGGATAAAFAMALLVLVVRPLWRSAPGPSDESLWRDAQAEFRRAEEHYQRAIADLDQLAGRAKDGWPEERRRHFEDARVAYDREIETCRRVAYKHPDDSDAQELLYRAYREEITFLEDALLRGPSVDKDEHL